MELRIKICGITSVADAEMAAECGADAIGLNFYPKSSRFLAIEDAARIALSVPQRLKIVGVFVNSSVAEVQSVLRAVRLNALQFHGEETAEFCAQWKNYTVIRALRLGDRESLSQLQAWQEAVQYLLIDAFNPQSYGGTGKEVSTDVLSLIKTPSILTKLILAGGLTPENVADKIKLLRPAGVDVASGVEREAGKKDFAKVHKFVAEARRALAVN